MKDKLGRNIIIKEYKKKFIKKIYSFNQNKIEPFSKSKNFNYSAHKLYMSKFFKNENNLIFLFFVNKSMAGYIKFIYKQKKYDISIIVDKKFNVRDNQKVLFYFKNNKCFLQYYCKVMKKIYIQLNRLKKLGLRKKI